jgi:ABC-type polysaccharide/polyol phosphate export permease
MPAKKGGGFIETMVASGVGAYAAKNSSSMKGLLWTLGKYILVIMVVSFILFSVLRLMSTENFVPVTPSAKGDEKTETPAGNVILH